MIGVVSEMSDWNKESSNLYKHAEYELTRAKVLGPDSADTMYGDMLGKAVLELVEVFARQGHSGMSASVTLWMFSQVANFKVLEPLTFDDDQWTKHDDETWQHVRQSSVFSRDQGKTWYDLDEEPRVYHAIEVTS